MSKTQWITPTLMMGETPPKIDRTRRVENATEALAAIAEGFTAVLPEDAWKAVRQILLTQGLSQIDVARRLKLLQSVGVDSSVVGGTASG